MLQRSQAGIARNGGQLPGQLGNDRLEPLGFKDPYRLRETAGREAFNAQRLGHFLQSHHLLEILDPFDQGVPGVEQHQFAVAVEEQFAVTCLVTPTAHLVQAIQQNKRTLEMAQAQNILLGQGLPLGPDIAVLSIFLDRVVIHGLAVYPNTSQKASLHALTY